MQYALINGQKTEASKGAQGFCPSCGSSLTAKCGEVKVSHWAHKGNRYCDRWWETETEWHRSWKNKFPLKWQEVIQTDKESGEKHIADVKTEGGWVLEFQHSHIKPEERHSRNAFYPKLVWVVDGTRRVRDKPKFYELLELYNSKRQDSGLKQFSSADESVLVKEWHDSNAHVFLDFQDLNAAKQPILWFLFPKAEADEAVVYPIPRDTFIEFHNSNTFDEFIDNTISPIIEKLKNEAINNAKMKEFRIGEIEKERAARMNWLKIGKNGIL